MLIEFCAGRTRFFVVIRHRNAQNIPNICVCAMRTVILHQEIKMIGKKMKSIFGLLLIVFACLQLGTMFGWLHMDEFWQQPWTQYVAPCALFYLGVHFLFRYVCCNRDQWLRRPLPIGEEGKRIRCEVSFGGDEYVFRGENFHGARLDAFFGGIRLDLREAVISEDEEIDIHTVFGGVELIVPENVNVLAKSRSIVGGVGNHAVRNLDEGAHCIYVIASNVFGGVSIANREE